MGNQKEDGRNIFSICLKMAWAEIKEGVKKMLKGTEKQVTWAEQIIADAIGTVDANIRLEEERIRIYGEGITTTVFLEVYKELRENITNALLKYEDAGALIGKRHLFDPSRINRLASGETMKRTNK